MVRELHHYYYYADARQWGPPRLGFVSSAGFRPCIYTVLLQLINSSQHQVPDYSEYNLGL